MAAIKRGQLDGEERRLKASKLGDLAQAEVEVFCWCNRCGHNAVIETARLMAELGPGYPVPEVGARLRCSGCGSKDVATRPHWPGLGQVTRHT
jgi:hypothetical protein